MQSLIKMSASQDHRAPSSRLDGDPTVSTLTSMPTALKHPHANSIDFSEQPTLNAVENFEKFSSCLLKNKNLLVPTRLALKRQRAGFKPPSRQILIEHVNSNTLQMELGNPDEGRTPIDYESDDGANTLITHTDTIGLPSRSNQSSTSRDTPHTAPTDISLLYRYDRMKIRKKTTHFLVFFVFREKPLFSHPVTGNYIVQYAEENGTPSPCSYVLPRKSYREKNAPAFSFGSRCLVEKSKSNRKKVNRNLFLSSFIFQ